MTRWALRIFVFLLLGAIVNVAVAWGMPPFVHGSKWDVGWPCYAFRNEWQEWLPLWPGFAINTVFYACVLWLLLAGPFVVRRWRRIRRGLCPKCAYDLRGTSASAACPECGATATPKPVR